jgi:hypothetical protein
MASTTWRAKQINVWRRRAMARGAQLEFQQPLTIRIYPIQAQPWDEATSGYPTEIKVPYARNIERGTKRTLGRGPQSDIQVPLSVRQPVIASFGDGDGAASGDATASGALDALADFAGAASGDSTASGTLDALANFDGAASGDSTASAEGTGGIPLPFSRSIERGSKRTLGRGWRLELSSPTPLRAPAGAVTIDGDGAASGDSTASGALDAFGDFAGAASGDSTASGALDAFGDFAGAASGDSTASGAITGTYDRPLSATFHLLTQQAARRKQRPVIENQRPLPIAILSNRDTAGTAIGDSTVSGSLDALADFTGSAIGDSIASAEVAQDGDAVGTAAGDSTASGGFDAFADFAGSASGDSIASGAIEALADFAGSATGDAIAGAEGLGEDNQDCAGSAIGDSTCEGFIEDATPVVVTPPVVDAGGTGGQVFRGAWTDRIKKPKRKKRLDDLDEMIAELRSRIEEVPVESTAEDIYQRTLRVSQALANQSDPSLLAIDNQLVLLQAAINEIDDEEAILLLAA